MKASIDPKTRSLDTQGRPGTKSVVVVRPYGQSIRDRVYELLARAGLDMPNAHVLEKHTPDDEVVAQLLRRRYQALLVPFHAHRDRDGVLVNGLNVLNLLAGRDRSLASIPIFMPISNMGLSAAKLMLSRDSDAGGLDDSLRGKVLFMPESELDDPLLRRNVVAHTKGKPHTSREL